MAAMVPATTEACQSATQSVAIDESEWIHPCRPGDLVEMLWCQKRRLTGFLWEGEGKLAKLFFWQSVGGTIRKRREDVGNPPCLETPLRIPWDDAWRFPQNHVAVVGEKNSLRTCFNPFDLTSWVFFTYDSQKVGMFYRCGTNVLHGVSAGGVFKLIPRFSPIGAMIMQCNPIRFQT